MAMRTPWAVRVFFALVFVAFTCVFPYQTGVNNPNENVRVYMTMAIVDEGTFRIDTYVDRYGWVNDMARARGADGRDHLYSVKGPAVSYAGVPVYWAFAKIAPHFGHARPTAASGERDAAWWRRAATFALRLFVVQLPCFAFLVWLERWLRATTTDVSLRLSAVAAAGLGTNYLAYSLMFVSHALGGAATFVSFAVTTREMARARADRRASRALVAGAFAGLATLLEYQLFPLSVILAIYALCVFLRRPLACAAFAATAAACACALMFFQWRAFGHPLTPGHTLAEHEKFARWHSQGLYGIGWPNGYVLRDLSTSATFGFFGMSQYMWLGLLWIPGLLFANRWRGSRADNRRRLTATLVWATMMSVLWVAISGAINWRGGWTVGPRFFGCAPPFFALGGLCALEAFARLGPAVRSIARGIGAGLALAGACTVGLISLGVDAVPDEEVVRPLPELTIPLARAGFVPHHAGELFGWSGAATWYVIAGCAIGAALLPALWPAREGAGRATLRTLTAAIAFVLGMRPAFAGAVPRGHPSPSSERLAWFARNWEPPGRDFVARARALAIEKGREDPCAWHRLASVERTAAMFPEADLDEARAAGAGKGCGLDERAPR